MRHTPDWVWAGAYLAAGLCALAFLALDPEPSLLLAASAGLMKRRSSAYHIAIAPTINASVTSFSAANVGFATRANCASVASVRVAAAEAGPRSSSARQPISLALCAGRTRAFSARARFVHRM